MFSVLDGEYWVCRGRALEGEYLAVVKDVSGTVTVVSEERLGECAGPYKVLASEEMSPNTVGFLAKASSALAEAKIPIMVYASYERDYILVPSDLFEKAKEALERAGLPVKQ